MSTDNLGEFEPAAQVAPPAEPVLGEFEPAAAGAPAPAVGDFAPAVGLPADLQGRSGFPREVPEQLASQGPEALDQAMRLSKGDLYWSLRAAQGISPDQAAKVHKIARSNGIPFNLAASNPSDVEQWDKAHRMWQDLSATDESGKLKHPVTVAFFRDPVNVAKAGDDLQALREVEDVIRKRQQAGEGGFEQAARAAKGMFFNMAGNANRIPGFIAKAQTTVTSNFYDAIGLKETAAGIRSLAPDWLLNPDLANNAEAWAARLKPVTIEKNVVDAVQGGDFAGAAASLRDQVIFNAPSSIAAAASAWAGMPGLGLAFLGGSSAAGAYQEKIDSGGTQEQAVAHGLLSGAAEVAFEKIGTFKILDDWEKAMTKQVGKDATRQVMGEYAKLLSASMLKEGYTEGLTTVAQSVSDYATGNDQALENVWKQSLNDLLVGAFSGGGMVAPMGALHGAVKVNQANRDARLSSMVQDIMDHQTEVDKAVSGSEGLDAINKAVASVSLTQKDPEAMAQAVQASLDQHGGPASVFVNAVDARNVFMQSAVEKGLSEQEASVAFQSFTQSLGVAPEALESAIKIGGDVEIKTGPYVVAAVNTPELHAKMQGLLSYEQGGLRGGELEAEKQKLKDGMKKMRDEIESLNSERGESVELKKIRSKLMAKPEHGGAGMTAEKADASILIFGTAFGRLAKQQGIKLDQLIQRMELEVRGGEDGAAFMQRLRERGVAEAARIQPAYQPPKLAEEWAGHFDKHADDPIRVTYAKEGATLSAKAAFAQWEKSGPKSVTNGDMVADVSGNSLRKMISGGKDYPQARIALVSSLEEVFQNGMRFDRLDDGRDPSIEAISHVYAPFVYDGQMYRARFVVKKWKPEVVDRTKLHSLRIQDIILEKENAGQSAGGVPEGALPSTASPSTVTLRQLFNGVNPFRDVKNIAHLQGGDKIPRGATEFRPDGKVIVNLFTKSDASTFIHEALHIYLREIRRMIDTGNAPDRIKQDLSLMEKWAGVKPGEVMTEKQEEDLAQAWEAYFLEGKAPTVELYDAFERLSAWLSRIYRSISALGGVKLDEDLRGAFDRILASEDEIERARQFYAESEDLIEKGIADAKERAEWREKREQIKQRQNAAQIRRALSAYWQAVGGREGLKRQVTEALDKSPMYSVLNSAMKSKKAEDKLSLEELKERVGEEAAKKISATHPEAFSVAGGVALADVAARGGFSTPDEVADALRKALPRSEAIRAGVEAEIAKKTEEIKRGISAAQDVTAADGSTHSEESLAFLAGEAQVLSDQLAKLRRTSPARIEDMMFGHSASEIIKKEKAGMAGRYHQYAREERRQARIVADLLRQLHGAASVKALTASERADILERALDAKKKQLLNHHLALKSIKAREELAAIEKRYYPRALDGALKGVENSFVDPILTILTRYKLTIREPSKQAVINEASLTALDETLPAMAPKWLLAGEKQGDYRDKLTLEELRELDEFIQSMLGVGRDEMLSLQEGEKQSLTDYAFGIIATMDKLKEKRAVQDEDRFASIKRMFQTLRDSSLQVQFLADMADNFSLRSKGVLGKMRALYQRMVTAEEQEMALKKKISKDAEPVFEKIRSTIARIEKENGKWFTLPWLDKHPEAMINGKGKWTAAELVCVMMNTGNNGNVQALTNAYGWNQRQLEQLAAMFNEDELKAFQALGDVTESLWEDLDAAHFKIYNRHLKGVEPQAREWLSKDGKTVKLKGWYYPLKFDRSLDTRAAKFEEESLMDRMGGVQRSTKPEDGMTKGRVGSNGLPPKLTLDVWTKNISDTIHYITHSAVVRDWYNLTGKPEWRHVFVQKFGVGAWERLRDWIKFQANPQKIKSSDPMTRTIDNIMDYNRNMATYAMLGFKFKTALSQQTAIINAAHQVGWRWIIGAYFSIGRNYLPTAFGMGDSWKRIKSLSNYMGNVRENVIEREIREMTEGLNPDRRALNVKLMGKKITVQEFRDMAFAWLRMNDRACVSVVWEASFQKYLKTLADASKTHDQQIAAAAQYADTQVQDTQPSSLKAELAGFQRDPGAWRFITMFMSWSVKYGNRLAFERKAYQEGRLSGKEYFSHVAHEWFLEPWLRLMIFGALSGQLPRWWDFLKAPIDSLLQWIPGVRDIMRMWNGKKGKLEFDLDRVVPASEGIKRWIKTVDSAIGVAQERREAIDLMLELYRTGEFFTGIPASNIVKDVSRFVDNYNAEDE